MRPFSTFLTLCLTAALAACASAPLDYPSTPSSAIPASGDTHWGGGAAEWQVRHGDLSGFVSMEKGIDALGVRIELMSRAEATIDAQYFIVKRDLAGAVFVGELLRAADRGVRVRLLVDDIFSPGVDDPLSLLSSHPNVEVRLFNPLARTGPRSWNYLKDFQRVNRRMHNKTFTVDNALTIVGGRNIGEEYFELKQDVTFDDFEMLAIGPVVEQVSASFDQYWNSDLSVPMEAFGRKVDAAKLDEWRAWIDEQVTSEGSVYRQAREADLLSELSSGARKAKVAPALVVSDPPEKLQGEIGDRDLAPLAVELGSRLRQAEREVIVITPYYIPQEDGVALVESVVSRGVRLVIITNSLASTNHVAVYSGYRRYRKRLLEAGAEIYEIRPDAINLDPRSIYLNSEIGMFIESEEAAGRLHGLILEAMDTALYRVSLDTKGNLQWSYPEGDAEVTLTTAPLTSWWRRLQVNFYSLLPIEDQL